MIKQTSAFFVNKYARKTKRFAGFIVDQLRALDSISNISRMLPYLAVTNTHLPKVLCIDEFKGNSGHYKYQVALIVV